MISLEKQVDFRWPFEVTRLPLLCRLQKGAHAKYRSRTRKRLVGKPFRTLYRFAFNVLGLGGEGIFTLEIDGKRRPCPFNARNTQFGALFATPSRYGYEPATSRWWTSFWVVTWFFTTSDRTGGFIRSWPPAIPAIGAKSTRSSRIRRHFVT